MSLEPSTIGRYKVLGILGSGAMGTVYLAEDPRLKRSLAIKVVREGTGDAEVLRRFTREAEVSAQLNHPNAVTVYDVGEEPHLGPYLVMERVEGESLADLLARGPLEPALALDLLLQAREALEAVHALGILHRDIKPGNFMVGPDGRLKLMDFGIARGDQSRLTDTSTFLGSPAYAAPEVLNGGPATEASDTWSLTLTAFEMLTGRLAFPGDSVGATLYRIVHADPTWPEGFPAPLQAVFGRALAKDPAARYPDLRALLTALAEALDLPEETRRAALDRLSAGPVLAARTQSFRLPAPPSRWNLTRFRWPWVAAGAALLLGAALLAFRRESSRVLSFESRPSGAEVVLDGVSLGRTPLRQVVVKGRADRVRIQKPDFTPVDLVLKPADQVVSVSLAPAPFEVAVASDPPGAEVFLDGDFQGRAPLKLQVPGEGAHHVRLALDGHQPWTAPLERHKPLPDPVRLVKGKAKGAKEGKLRKFFKGIFQ